MCHSLDDRTLGKRFPEVRRSGKRFPPAIMQKVPTTRRTDRYFLHDRERELPTRSGKALSGVGGPGHRNFRRNVRTEWHIRAT
jgi:hypothetical protein